ncbi:MAG: hypothetical protein AAB558_01945 [Patescibacteria group bacterium]
MTHILINGRGQSVTAYVDKYYGHGVLANLSQRKSLSTPPKLPERLMT